MVSRMIHQFLPPVAPPQGRRMATSNSDYIRWSKGNHYPLAVGRKEFLARLEGKKLSRAEAMKAKCYGCMNNYIDGKMDCLVEDCELYQYMPYRRKDED